MTSDAKIGLLLGLFFIVIIAFVINGLPNLFDSDQRGELISTSIVDSHRESLIIGEQTDRAVESIEVAAAAEQSGPTEICEADYAEVRFVSELAIAAAASDEPKEPQVESFVEKEQVQTYVVQDGDNLGDIAKKVYGPERGNKNAIVRRLFQANSKVLSSPDEVSVGDTLFIPCLSLTREQGGQEESVQTVSMLEKVKTSMGRGILALKSTVGGLKGTEYVVRPGDSLWKIADRFLGDGDRYYEIVEENSDVIYDAEEIIVGMSLKIPRR